MRKSSIYMLIAAVVLGLIAVFFARVFLLKDDTVPTAAAVQTVPAVVAAAELKFGDKITADKLKVVQWPAAGIPAGTFQRVSDVVAGGDKVALRALAENELLTATSVSGQASRLSASPLLGKDMRAAAVPISEPSGSGGFIAPGDRVDVFLTRTPSDEELPYTDLLIQNARVLAVGQDSNVGLDKPAVVRTATIEVTPLQAQKIALAQSVGTLSMTLRNIADESRVRLETAQILDLNDGTVTRVLRKPRQQPPAAPPTPQAAGPAGPPRPSGPQVEIVRNTPKSTESTSYGVSR